VGAGAGGRLTLWLVALAVLVASGATGIVVSGSGPAPPAGGGSQDTTHMVGSSDQRPDRGQQATAQARPVPAASAAARAAAGVTATGPAGRYNVGAAHSPELLRELARPLAGTGEPSGTLARGVDVAAAQHAGGAGIDWPQVAAAGYSFAAVKATEGTYYANPRYGADTAGAAAAGLQVTGYHVAIPNVSGGAPPQADYAVRHLGQAAGGQAVGERSRPLELDVEYDPYTATDHTDQCYGLSPARLVAWIGAFIREAERVGGQAPVIYTSAAWWRACTGDSSAFSADPLWLAGYGTAGATSPAAWASWSYWQFTSAGTVPGIAASGATDVSYAGASRTAVVTPAEAGGVAGASGLSGVAGGTVAGPGASGGSGGSGGPGGSGGSRASGGRTAAPVPAAAASPVASAPESLVVPAATPPAKGSPSPVSPSGP
jgi:GH25 family lysozyme M1 (1,4-beta-N-acetylmuramidase)